MKSNVTRVYETLDYIRDHVHEDAADVVWKTFSRLPAGDKNRLSEAVSLGWRGFGKQKQQKTNQRAATRAVLLCLGLYGSRLGRPFTPQRLKSIKASVVAKTESYLKSWLGRELAKAYPPRQPPRGRGPLWMRAQFAIGQDEARGNDGFVYRVYRQEKEQSCGPTCCRIVLANHFPDNQYDEETLRDHTRDERNYTPYFGGRTMAPLAAVLSRNGANARFEPSCDWSDLRAAVQPNGGRLRPAIIRIQWRGSNAGHFIVVANMHTQNFVVIDPLFGGVQDLTDWQLHDYVRNQAHGFWDGSMVRLD